MDIIIVGQRVKVGWTDNLHTEILACPADSVVGRRIISYLQCVDIVLAMTEESSEHDAIEQAAIRQCNVWFFG